VAEKYFDMYCVSRDTWASFATLHFRGNAALWLQTYEAMHDVDCWEELVVAVTQKFGRDKHHRYLEALERIAQLGSVDDYHHKFEELMHKVLVYNNNYDEAFFVTKFVKGLKMEIQTTIRLHKPRTVDAALSLAQTQEDMIEEARSSHKVSFRQQSQSHGRHQFYQGKGILGAAPTTDKIAPEEKHKLEQKLDALKKLRKEKGLCFKCGDKFNRGHKCAPSTQVQLIDDLLHLLDYKDDSESSDCEQKD
jgi:hypothetical protein